MMPPSSFVSSVYCACPGSSRSRSFESAPCRSSRARGPSTSSSPMCETSKTPASARTARCSGMTPSYCTGISQPANGTMRAPAATCFSYSGVRRSVCTEAMLLNALRAPSVLRSAAMHVVTVDDPAARSHVAAAILRELPEWFGLPDSTEAYVRRVRGLETFLAGSVDAPAGFLALEQHTPYAAEIHVMGVARTQHRQGIGRARVGA